MVVQLANAKLVEPKTAAKERWSLLDLEDPKAKDAKSSLVRLLDAHGKPISEVVVGKSRPNAFGAGRGGVYVRRPSETQTWLAAAEPNISIDVKDWVDVAIYKTDVTKFRRVTVEHANEVPIVVEKGSEPTAKFELKSVPEGVKVKANAPVEQIALGFGSIDFEDVRQLDKTPIGETVSIITTKSTDGLTVTFRLHREATPAAALAVVHGGGHRRRQEGRRRDQRQSIGLGVQDPRLEGEPDRQARRRAIRDELTRDRERRTREDAMSTAAASRRLPGSGFGAIAARLPPTADGQAIGLLGGSFNPAHAAHLEISETAIRRLRLRACGGS